MHIGVIGINHKLADLSLRETLAIACKERFCNGNFLHDDHTFIVLSTCNRTEIYFTSNDLPATHTFLLGELKNFIPENFDQKLYSYFGYHCFYHLARVTAGLDSAIIAETEIQGQVKTTYETAAKKKRLQKEMHYLFQKALKIGKTLRSSFCLSQGMPDLEQAVFSLGKQQFDTPENKHILFIGASAINQKILHHFKRKKCSSLTLCNRSEKKGLECAKKHGVPFLPWQQKDLWQEFDWIILGTKAEEHVLRNPEKTDRKKLIIDLGVPRNADPRIDTLPNFTLLNIDQINNQLNMRKSQLTEKIEQAEKRIALEACKHLHLFREKEKRCKSFSPFDEDLLSSLEYARAPQDDQL